MHEASLYAQLLTAIDFNYVRTIIVTFFIHNLVWNTYCTMTWNCIFCILEPATFAVYKVTL